MNTVRGSFYQSGRNALLTFAALLCAQPALLADAVGYLGTANGSASAEACAGLGYSDNLIPGQPWVPGVNGAGGATVCNFGTGALVGEAASNILTNPGHPNAVDNSAVTATVGQLHLNATHSADANYFLPEAYSDAGWNDLATVHIAGVADGTAGLWAMPIAVSGIFTASGTIPTSSPFADGFLEVFQNGNDVQDYNPSYDAAYNLFLALNGPSNDITGSNTSCIGPGWSPEMVGWASTVNCTGASPNTTAWFVLPVILGQQLQFGIWADIAAGEGSDGSVPPGDPADSAAANLGNSILWGGPGYFVSGGQTYTDISITSGSGFDYNSPAVDSVVTPEPSTALLLGCSAIALCFWRRKRAGPTR